MPTNAIQPQLLNCSRIMRSIQRRTPEFPATFSYSLRSKYQVSKADDWRKVTMKGFLTGLSIGAALGFLYAPRSGRELRQQFGRSASRHADEIGERLESLSRPASRQTRQSAGQRSAGGAATASSREPSSQTSTPKAETRKSGNLLDIINEWPEERLIEIDGIGPVLAGKIIKNRPYESETDLINSKELPPSAIKALRNAS